MSSGRWRPFATSIDPRRWNDYISGGIDRSADRVDAVTRAVLTT